MSVRQRRHRAARRRARPITVRRTVRRQALSPPARWPLRVARRMAKRQAAGRPARPSPAGRAKRRGGRPFFIALARRICCASEARSGTSCRGGGRARNPTRAGSRQLTISALTREPGSVVSAKTAETMPQAMGAQEEHDPHRKGLRPQRRLARHLQRENRFPGETAGSSSGKPKPNSANGTNQRQHQQR